MVLRFSSPRVPPAARHWLFAVVALFVGCCAWAGCVRPASPPAAKPETAFVGAQACAECHADIFNKQSGSPHARTLRSVTAADAEFANATEVRKTNPDNGLEYRLENRDGRWCQVRFKDGREQGFIPVQFLVGSGVHGVSPMSRDAAGWMYLALTYYAHGGWDVSPMHGLETASLEDRGADGWPVRAGELQKCWGCHSTRLEFTGSEVAPEKSELGVRCESCHGPGRAHIAAARAKSQDLAVQNPGKWSTQSFMALCQQCHNETATVEGTLMGISEDPADRNTVKYHVHGLQQSRCFQQSKGAMTCVTCHDPHGKSETQAPFYEKRCIECHDPRTAGQVTCGAGQTQNCLPCHMPKVEVEKYTHFADHWIRARSPFAQKPVPRAK